MPSNAARVDSRECKSHRLGSSFIFTSKKGINCRERAAWVGEIRSKPVREVMNGRSLLGIQTKTRTGVGKGADRLLCDLAFELRLYSSGRRGKRKAKK